MSAHESMEQADQAKEASSENRKIALLIAVIALCLALSETLGKGAQTESISKNVESSNLWAFFQAKSIRRTVVQTASEQAKLGLGTAGEEAAKAAVQKQIDEWQKTAARIVPSRKPAKAPNSWPNAPSTPRRSATLQRLNITTSSLLRRRFRSASYWLREPSSPA